MMIDETGLQRLAGMAHALRPDWPPKSLATYLHAHHAHRPYRDLAVALAWVAADSSTRTPKRLEENGPWWKAVLTETSTSTQTVALKGACPKCGLWTVEGEDHTCGRRADLATARGYADQARLAIRKAKAETIQ